MDYNSNINQDIKGMLVQREVYHRLTTMMTEVKDFGDWQEDFDALHYSIDYEMCIHDNYLSELSMDELGGLAEGYFLPTQDKSREELARDIFNYLKDEDMLDDFLNDNNIDPEYYEIYEYWAVSDYLAEKLKGHGEPVAEIFDFNVWGRGTSGQAILLDYVISKIAEDMEILDGQPNAWEKR